MPSSLTHLRQITWSHGGLKLIAVCMVFIPVTDLDYILQLVQLFPQLVLSAGPAPRLGQVGPVIQVIQVIQVYKTVCMILNTLSA